MPIVLRQDVQLARLISRIEHGALRVKKLSRGLSSHALAWQPPGGGWGMIHYLERAYRSAEPYLKHLPPVIKKNIEKQRFARNGRWRVSIPAGIVRWTINTTGGTTLLDKKPTTTPDALSRFLRRQQEIIEMLRTADGLRLDRIHCRLGGLMWWTLADCCTLLVARTERDLAGLKRVREHPDFPERTGVRPRG